MARSDIPRTTITVPKELVDHLQAVTDAATKTEAVVNAIHEEIRRQKLLRFRALAGKIRLGRSLSKMRHHDHRLR